jgi:hypothetical protein
MGHNWVPPRITAIGASRVPLIYAIIIKYLCISGGAGSGTEMPTGRQKLPPGPEAISAAAPTSQAAL